MNSILELVQKYNFDQLARTESGNAVLYCSPEDYRELRTLSARLAEAELNYNAEIYRTLDWERWAREVLTDFRVPFDNHTVGLRLGIVQLIHDMRDAK